MLQGSQRFHILFRISRRRLTLITWNGLRHGENKKVPPVQNARLKHGKMLKTETVMPLTVGVVLQQNHAFSFIVGGSLRSKKRERLRYHPSSRICSSSAKGIDAMPQQAGFVLMRMKTALTLSTKHCTSPAEVPFRRSYSEGAYVRRLPEVRDELHDVVSSTRGAYFGHPPN